MFNREGVALIQVLAAGAFSFLFFGVPPVFAGFGVSPPSILEDRLVPGSHFEQVISLVQGNPEEPVDINVTVESEKIKDWITFREGTSFTIPAGVQQFPLHVVIDVPEDTDLGIYRAFIRVNTDPENAKAAGEVAISIGGRIDVELTIGDDIVTGFRVRRINFIDVTEGQSPKIGLTIENIGNVPIAPDTVSMELFNKYGDIRLAYAEVSEGFEEIPSFSEGEIIVEFPLDIRLAPGEYWANIRVHDDSGITIRQEKGVFNVKEKTLLAKALAPSSIVIVLAIIIGGALLLRRRKTA